MDFIKKILVLFAFFCLVFLICSKETTERNNVNPVEYLLSFGWHIEEKFSERTQDANKPVDLDAMYTGIDLKPYKEVHITTYLLKEKQKTGKKLYADIYQVNEDIIGGYGSAEGWVPGTFSLKDKEELIKEGLIK
ncbi:DUF4830 domain-containing protein [Paenibacillus sp. ATY16]|uniref:DUF4830 domain-containing protein n=1 Tax=Paenibacillus sp. ATY16 TaxID=1759312 RepID=UPI0013C2B71E|nr:DUF4830 domain-containing protein [Paenibacillus sp. ATY16]MCK9859284.1 DUF4830 domain-containing protein [Paenibacillus sp. ATY16]